MGSGKGVGKSGLELNCETVKGAGRIMTSPSGLHSCFSLVYAFFGQDRREVVRGIAPLHTGPISACMCDCLHVGRTPSPMISPLLPMLTTLSPFFASRPFL